MCCAIFALSCSTTARRCRALASRPPRIHLHGRLWSLGGCGDHEGDDLLCQVGRDADIQRDRVEAVDAEPAAAFGAAVVLAAADVDQRRRVCGTLVADEGSEL